MRVLVTGASGLIGKALSESLSKDHEVVCMSRNDPGLDLTWVQGTFADFDDLKKLDEFAFDAVVHLGARLPDNEEHEFIHTNVEASRRLMRYLMDHGCKKFVMASSIGAAGIQSVRFRPVQIPIPDTHPCLDRDGYGLSKYLMEEVTKYCWRQNEDIDVLNLRLSTVRADDDMPDLVEVRPISQWALGAITMMTLTDAVRAFTLAAEAPYQPGVQILNAASPEAWVADPVVDVLRGWWGDDVPLDYFERSGNVYQSVFDVRKIEEELGFVAQDLPPRA